MSLPAEVVEEMIVDEMLAAAAHGGSAAKVERWERAWTICAGYYKRHFQYEEAKRCEDYIVAMRALCKAEAANQSEVAS